MYDFLLVVNRHHSSKLLNFWENRVFFILATDRQTDRQTDEQTDSTDALSRSRCRERRLNKDSLMRRRVCVIHCTVVRHTQTSGRSHRSIAKYCWESRFVPTPPAFDAPVTSVPVCKKSLQCWLCKLHCYGTSVTVESAAALLNQFAGAIWWT